MRHRRQRGCAGPGRDELPPGNAHKPTPREWQFDTANANSPEDVLGEVGLVLVIVLGIVVAINMILIALHVA